MVKKYHPMILFGDSLISLATPSSIRIGESESRDGVAGRDKPRKAPISRYSLTLHEFMATGLPVMAKRNLCHKGLQEIQADATGFQTLKIKPKFG